MNISQEDRESLLSSYHELSDSKGDEKEEKTKKKRVLSNYEKFHLTKHTIYWICMKYLLRYMQILTQVLNMNQIKL
jgi:hypothetical protein